MDSGVGKQPQMNVLPEGKRAGGKAISFDVSSLFAGRRELCLIHDCQEYRLRITRNNKLILTK